MKTTLAAALTALLLAACAPAADKTLSPDPAVSYAPMRHPFRHATLYRDPNSSAAKWQAAHGKPAWLNPIVQTPQAIWLTSPQDLGGLPVAARNAAAQRALLVLVAYYIPNRGCTDNRDGAPTAEAYRAWIDELIRNLGPAKAAVILEPDALPSDCFDAQRAALLRQATERLSAAGHYVYLDAGHPRWKSSGETAERLLASGIQSAEGFSINVSNRQSTRDSAQWGLEVSDLAGNREFVIDTSRNGLGPPPDDATRDDEWCNPDQQGLGQRPNTAPGLPRTAALLWIKRPGESDGLCGGENTYEFSPRQARHLVANASWVPAALRAQAEGR